MEVVGILLVVVIIRSVFGAICSAIASNKGRTPVGWFFGGFFLDVIGIVIVAVLPNLKTQQAKEQRIERENRRLREQLRQEQIKGESFRQHTAARLDAHDSQLGIDTRRTLPENEAAPSQLEAFGMPSGSASLESESTTDQGDLSQLANASNETRFEPTAQLPSPPRPERSWHYEQYGEAHGPIGEQRLVAMLRSGELDGATLVWTESLSDWKPVDEISSLRPHVQF